MAVENRTDRTIRLLSLCGLDGLLDLPGDAGDWTFYRMGACTFAPSGALGLDKAERDFSFRGLPPQRIPAPIRRMLYLDHETSSSKGGDLSSEWFALLDGPANRSLLAGFMGTHRHFSRIDVSLDAGVRKISARALADGVEVRPGRRFAAEPLMISASENPHDLLERYAKRLGRRQKARFRETSIWTSWYSGFYDHVDPEGLMENLRHLSAPEPLVEFFQLDDGYQRGLGDWLRTNARLPGGLQDYASRVRERGLKPGLWLAPFSISKKAPLFREHPEWLVRKPGGGPLLAGVIGGLRTLRPYYALDTTHPDALDWLRELFGQLVDWGFELFKLDFLLASCVAGKRHDVCATRAMAYEQGIRTIRETVGDRVLLGAIAPVLTNVGLFDIQRTGADTSFGDVLWERALQRLMRDRISPCVRNALRNPIARHFTDGTLWTADADAVVQRGLSPAELETHVSVALLTSSMLCIGHDFRTGDYDRSMIDKLRSFRIMKRIVPDLLEIKDPAEIMALAEDGGAQVLLYLLVNWEKAEANKLLRDPLPLLPGIDPDWNASVDLWTGARLEIHPGACIPIAPHGCRLLQIPLK